MPGSGKTTVAKILAEKLNLKRYSMGDLRGKMALERGLTIDELNKLGETEAFTDHDADEYQKKLGEQEDNFVIDGWLSWYFIPKSIKIFMSVDWDEAGRRVFEASKDDPTRADEPKYSSPEEATETIRARADQSNMRYEKYYKIRFDDQSNFDLVIDTTTTPAKQVAEKILDFVKTQNS